FHRLRLSLLRHPSLGRAALCARLSLRHAVHAAASARTRQRGGPWPLLGADGRWDLHGVEFLSQLWQRADRRAPGVGHQRQCLWHACRYRERIPLDPQSPQRLGDRPRHAAHRDLQRHSRHQPAGSRGAGKHGADRRSQPRESWPRRQGGGGDAQAPARSDGDCGARRRSARCRHELLRRARRRTRRAEGRQLARRAAAADESGGGRQGVGRNAGCRGRAGAAELMLVALETHNAWPAGVLTRVPNWIYQSADIYAAEQENIFRGAAWTFLCLEIDIPRRGDYRTAALGDMPVIVVREDNRAIRAFENRCAHRGALLAFDDGGTVEDFTCVYHNWRYDLCGNLQSIAFRNGVQGKGGMPKDFAIGERGPRKLRVESVCGLVFGTLSQAAPPLEEFLGEEVVARIARVCRAPMEIIGRFKQTLPNNWKLFMENTRDSYHASLLHVFFTTFRLNRLSQRGGLMVSKTGAHSVSWSALDKAPSASAEYNAEQLRADKKDFLLADPSLIEGFDEFGDGITLQVI